MTNQLPSPQAAGEFNERIRCLCALYDCSITSVMRTEKRNKAVGGSPSSYHQISRGGLGADLVPDDMELKDELCDAGRCLGLDMIDEGDHVHAEPSGG